MILSDIESKVQKLVEDRRYAKKRGLEAKATYQQTKVRYIASQRVQEIIQHVAQHVQSQAYGCVANVVSKCLEAVFEEPYELQMDFNQKRGHTEVEISFIRDGKKVDPIDASGGGVVDVAAFGLRVASILLAAGRIRRILVLDEPFKFLSACYRERARLMLETIAKEMGFQIIMVTHIDEFRLGTVIDLDQG